MGSESRKVGAGMTEGPSRPPASMELEAALRSLGVADPAPHERGDSHAWVTDWSGDIHGHDVYVLVMGARNNPENVRLMLDNCTFEDVRTEHVRELVRKVFTGDARVTRRRALFSKHFVLEVRAGSTEYSASMSDDSVDELSPWAKPLVTP